MTNPDLTPTPEETLAIDCEGLTYAFSEGLESALNGVDLKLKRGDRCLLVGANGGESREDRRLSPIVVWSGLVWPVGTIAAVTTTRHDTTEKQRLTPTSPQRANRRSSVSSPAND